MSPSIITIDPSSDFDFNPSTTPQSSKNGTQQKRTLLLAPPSIASHAERIGARFATFDRQTTDLQMLDRLAGGLVTLPRETYDLILVLTEADGSRRAESAQLLANRALFARLVDALKAGGRLASEDGSLGKTTASAEGREAVLAGLVTGSDGFTKPEVEEEAVPLRFGLKKKVANGTEAVPLHLGKKENLLAQPIQPSAPVGVGFVDLSDDLDFMDDEDDDDLIDDDELLTEEELNRIPQRESSFENHMKKKKKKTQCSVR
jgi:hypothetical protein